MVLHFDPVVCLSDEAVLYNSDNNKSERRERISSLKGMKFHYAATWWLKGQEWVKRVHQSTREVCCLRCGSGVTTCNHCVLVQVIVFILHLPCVLYEITRQLVLHVMKKQSGDGNYSPVDDDCMVCGSFGNQSSDAEGEEEVEEYKHTIMGVCDSEWGGHVSETTKAEVSTICHNEFLNKLGVWVQLFQLQMDADRRNLISNLLVSSMVSGKTETAMFLTQSFPDLLHRQVSGTEYDGFTPFHLAIIYKQHALLAAILDGHNGDDIEGKHAFLHQKADRPKSGAANQGVLYPSAEIPLTLAVLSAEEDIVRLLIVAGAEMSYPDSKGNNVMHAAVSLARIDKVSSTRMFHLLMGLIDEWASRSKACAFLQDFKRVERQEQAKRLLLLAQNFDGYTPLKLAAKIGSPELVDLLMNVDGVYRFDLLDCGARFSAMYDVSEMDPFLVSLEDKVPAVLEIVAFQHDSEEALSIFKTPTAERLFKEKRKAYRPSLVIGAYLHWIIFIWYNVEAYYSIFPRLVTVPPVVIENLTDTYNTTIPDEEIIRFTMQTFDYVVLVLSLVYGSHCILAGRYIWITVRKRNRIRFLNWVSLVHVLMTECFLLFTLNSLLYVLLKAVHSQLEVLFLASALFMGTICTFLYTRLFKATAVFTIMIERVLIKDITRFLLVIVILIVAFAMAVLALLAADNNLMDGGLYLTTAIFNLFRFATGVSDIAEEAEITESSHTAAIKILYFEFVIGINIMMMNMLVAAMNSTYAQIMRSTHLLYQQVQFRDMCALEAILPTWLNNKTTELYKTRLIPYRDDNGQQQERQLHLLKVDATVKPGKKTHHYYL